CRRPPRRPGRRRDHRPLVPRAGRREGAPSLHPDRPRHRPLPRRRRARVARGAAHRLRDGAQLHLGPRARLPDHRGGRLAPPRARRAQPELRLRHRAAVRRLRVRVPARVHALRRAGAARAHLAGGPGRQPPRGGRDGGGLLAPASAARDPPLIDAQGTLAERLREQAAWTARLGSPLYTTLLEQAAADVEAGGPAWAVLAGYEADARASALALCASAGLNLRWDHYRYEQGDAGWGDRASPVRLVDVFPDGFPPGGRRCRVVERAGCDPLPLDPCSADGQITLLSYLWADQRE